MYFQSIILKEKLNIINRVFFLLCTFSQIKTIFINGIYDHNAM